MNYRNKSPRSCVQRAAAFSLLLYWVCPTASAALSPAAAAMNQPVAPFRIVGHLYYVGASDVVSYLLVTPAGHVLIDGGFADTAPLIESNIAALGFRLRDVKWLLNGHAHPDHAGGLSQLKSDTGARFAAMRAEIPPLEHNGRGTFYDGDRNLFDSLAVDRALDDGDYLDLGGIRLTAHRTPGHTPGCTTWTMRLREGRREFRIVIACQITVPSVGARYEGMDADFGRTFAVLRSLPCDVFLAEHGKAFSLAEKLDRKRNDPSSNPFIDPGGYARHVDQAEAQFDQYKATKAE
jgi:metallo-beta-lactamase class B